MATVTESLESGTALLAPSATARRDAELLMMHVTGSSRAELMTHPERELTQRQQEHFQAAIVRRVRHEPVQHILGTQEFYGRSFIVNRLVLIPRPETEHLVEAVLAIRPVPRYVLDIGTGSGILAITLALELPDAAVTATDISPAALAVAQQNARVLNAGSVFASCSRICSRGFGRSDLTASSRIHRTWQRTRSWSRRCASMSRRRRSMRVRMGWQFIAA